MLAGWAQYRPPRGGQPSCFETAEAPPDLPSGEPVTSRDTERPNALGARSKSPRRVPWHVSSPVPTWTAPVPASVPLPWRTQLWTPTNFPQHMTSPMVIYHTENVTTPPASSRRVVSPQRPMTHPTCPRNNYFTGSTQPTLAVCGRNWIHVKTVGSTCHAVAWRELYGATPQAYVPAH